jgi:uncharacterized repeat protein (TIGR02543 family)
VDSESPGPDSGPSAEPDPEPAPEPEQEPDPDPEPDPKPGYKPPPIPPAYYTITFDSRGGSPAAPQYGGAGTPVPKPLDPQKDGFDFLGWFSLEAGGDKYDNWPHIITGSITMYAQWTKTPVWTIVYDANGGDGIMSDSTAPAGENLTLEANEFTRTGCSFAGWAENKDGTKEYDDGATVSGVGKTAGKTLTLYALWTVTNAADFVTAATDGNTITLTGVAWNDDLKTALESALSSGGISLDLSGVSGLTAWNSTTLSTNKDKITSMVLPDTVTSLAYQSSTGAFQGYTKLTSVSGKGVTDLGRNAFYGCTELVEVSLSLVMEIGVRTFSGCSKLASVSLPAAATIGNYAFEQCYILASVYFQEAASIGIAAFINCTALTTVSLPAVETINGQAFYDCKALAQLFLPATPPTLSYEGQAGLKAFQNTTNPSVPLNIYVGLDNVEAYKSAWGVNETTDANGNTTAYGNDHKAINIVEVE